MCAERLPKNMEGEMQIQTIWVSDRKGEMQIQSIWVFRQKETMAPKGGHAKKGIKGGRAKKGIEICT